MSGTVLAIISDSHVGSSTALAPLEFTVHSRSETERQVTHANRLQEWLYECWTDYWEHVFDLAKYRRLIVVHCGDLVDGLHHGSLQVMNEVEDQVIAFKQLMDPILAKADGFYGVLGTGPSHAGMDNSTEAQIYRDLKAIEFGQTLTLSVDGVIHDFAHHGRAGSRPWTSGAANLAMEVMMDYATSKLPLPNYIWRGHRHVVDDSGNRIPGSRAISLPSWQLKTSFGWRTAGNTSRSDIGGYIVVDGLLDESKSRYRGQPDQRRIICA